MEVTVDIGLVGPDLVAPAPLVEVGGGTGQTRALSVSQTAKRESEGAHE